MKEIKINDKVIKLDIGNELRVKDIRRIQPIIENQVKWKEMEMIINLITELWGKEEAEKVDDMNMQEFELFSKEITKIFDFQKKKN